jgi:hypothetical protein
MPGDGVSLEEEIARRTGLSFAVVAAVVDEALVHQLDRFRRGQLYTFDAATPEDFRSVSEASGQSPAVVEAVLKAIGDVAIDWIPNEIVEGKA